VRPDCHSAKESCFIQDAYGDKGDCGESRYAKVGYEVCCMGYCRVPHSGKGRYSGPADLASNGTLNWMYAVKDYQYEYRSNRNYAYNDTVVKQECDLKDMGMNDYS
jgi:hypothetical protein